MITDECADGDHGRCPDWLFCDCTCHELEHEHWQAPRARPIVRVDTHGLT